MSDNNHDPRWDNDFDQSLLGESAASHPVPKQGSREANNAVLLARFINYYEKRLPQVGPGAMVALARQMVGRYYCRDTDRVSLDFPHQSGDTHDPGYRLTKILKPLSDALHSGPASTYGADCVAISMMCQELSDFDDAHTNPDDARFLPIAKMVTFLREFSRRVTEAA